MASRYSSHLFGRMNGRSLWHMSRRRACLLAAVMIGSSACADHGGDQASASPVPTFLTDQTLCEVVPRQLLEDGLCFYPTDFSYWHSPGHNSSRDTFDCHIHGIRMPQGLHSSLDVSYLIGGKFGAGAGSTEFTELDDKGLPRITFDDTQGRGCIWPDKNGGGRIVGGWLYPDADIHTLGIRFYLSDPRTANDENLSLNYDQNDINAMTELLHTLVLAVPPVAAGPSQRLIRRP